MPSNQDATDSSELKVGYYLDNFLTLVDYVQSRYRHLLLDTEINFADTIRSLDLQAARLYVRLILRTGPFFRLDKIHYPEIIDIDIAVNELHKKRFIKINDSFSAAELLPFLTCQELSLLCQSLAIPLKFNQLNKQQILSLILTYDHKLLDTYLSEQYCFLYPMYAELVQIYRLLFFGNLYQDMSEFILEDLGVLKFEKYQIQDKDRLFQSRELLEQTLWLLNLDTELRLAIDKKNSAEVMTQLDKIVALDTQYENIQRSQQKALILGARFLEKCKYVELALKYYQQTNYPPSRERQVRIWEKLGEDQKALEQLEMIEATPIDDSEQEFTRVFSAKLKKKLHLPFNKTKRLSHPSKTLELKRCDNLSIEQNVLNHYLARGWDGFYAENTLWNGLFGLFFWDIIFSSSIGAFFNPFQRGPKDLFSFEFRHNRQEKITQRLQELIQKGSYKKRILQNYQEKYLTANFLVRWKHLKLEYLKLTLEAIPAQHLHLIFNLMADNLGANRSGFPDLFVSRDETYQLIEVKGPGDQLQLSQRKWLKHFERWNIPYHVCRVTWL